MDSHAKRSTRVHWFGCRRRVWVSRGMAWPAVGVVRGGEASAASQPATIGRSTRHDHCCFWRVEREDQRLCPRCQGEESIFGRLKLEYLRLKKKHDIHWMDIQWPLLLEPCVDYKLIMPCIRVNLVFLRGRVNLVGPQVCGREHIAHLRFVRMYIPFLNSNGIYSPFTVC